MGLRHFLLALRARYLVALVVFGLTVAVVIAATELVPKRYSAETAVMVDIRSSDPVASLLLPQAIVPGNMSTQIEIIKSDLVARKVVGMLKLNENPVVRERWLAATYGKVAIEDWIGNLLQRGLSVNPSRDSNIIVIGYTGGDPRTVAAIANGFAQAYIEASIELKVDPARQYSRWFSEQAAVLRTQVEKAQARLSEFQREKGIVEISDTVDHELTRLTELSQKLAAAQTETRDAQTKQRSGALADGLPEVYQDQLVSGLRTSIAQLEVKLKEAGGNLGTQHPQYQRMVRELEELRRRLADETRHVAGRYATSTAIGRSKENELRAAIEAQKRKILDMKNDRDQIAVLQRDVETARRAYEAVTSRLSQSNLESQSTRSNVVVLGPALESFEPSFPKSPEKMLAIAIVLGLALAGGCIFGLETLDPRVRTPEDLAEMLQVPVLAVVARSHRPRWLALPTRLPSLPAP
jgi:polysaccharide biosynthesis transport protein